MEQNRRKDNLLDLGKRRYKEVLIKPVRVLNKESQMRGSSTIHKVGLENMVLVDQPLLPVEVPQVVVIKVRLTFDTDINRYAERSMLNQ